MRWGLGPVFLYECLINSRRWQTYALRSVGVIALLLAMSLTAASTMPVTGSSWRDYANMGEAYFVTLIGVELAVVLLAAPAATAGAICVDRARGTLAHMLMTDLSDAEIVLGKLAARLLPVFGLVACTWPVMAISSLLGGIDPIALTLAFAIILAVAILGCTTALAVSVWARKSHEVILATYTVFIAALLFWPIWYMLSMAGWAGPAQPWALLANPFYLSFAPYADPGKLAITDYLTFFGTSLGISALLTLLAVWRTRPVACRDSVQRSSGSRLGVIGRMTRWLPTPSLDRNPVLWREWHRWRPSVWMAIILTLLMGTTGALCVGGAIAFWVHGADFRPNGYWEIAGVCSYILHIIFGLLLLAAVAPTSMAEERQRGSLDLLAVTALSTRAIVVGKWLGTFRTACGMAICPGLLALAMATARSDAALNVAPSMAPDRFWIFPLAARLYGVLVVMATIVAHGALVTSIGLALAVWVKRQSRAIAMSVTAFVLVIAVWPILISMTVTHVGNVGVDLASLSPVVICSRFITFFTMRIYEYTGNTLWSGGFWSAEVFAVAIGILGLTIQTFDRCFDRIPDYPRRFSAWTVVVTTVAGMMIAGSLVHAIMTWMQGVGPGVRPDWQVTIGALTYSLLIAIVLVLVGIEAAREAHRRWAEVAALDRDTNIQKFVLERWREPFRFVLFLAIGPTLLAISLATAFEPPRYEPQYTKAANGTQEISSYVLAKPRPAYAGEVGLGKRLLIAAVFLGTILAHGGAAISVGLAFAAVKWSSTRERTLALVLVLIGGLLAPLCLCVGAKSYTLAAAAWSFVLASGSLLTLLDTRLAFNLGQTLWPVVGFDVVVVLFSGAICWWVARMWQIGLSEAPKNKPALATGVDGGSPAPEIVLAGE